MKKKSTIIIKKVKRGVHGGAHGGSWKVAYADFVTAMMAFFLLLWLIAMVSPEKRARVSAYFKYFSIYNESGSSFMESSSQIFSESGESSQKVFQSITENNIKDMEEELKKGIIGKLEDAKDQVIVDTVEGGVRIQMIDKDGSLMFETGSNKLTPRAKQILHVIGDNINNLPNKVTIEGHTDALPYANSDYSNWELSTERASTARKELEANGLDTERIERVSGYADKDPLITDDPQDPRNRRISIILKVPYVDNTKTAVKVDAQKSNEISRERDDGSSRMANKFEENLSLIKSGLKTAEKNSGDATVNKKTENTPVETKETVISEKKNWGAVIKKDEWSPVIKDELSPVIKNNTAVKNDNLIPAPRQDNSKPILKDIHIPAVNKDTSKPVKTDIEKSAYDYLIKSSKTKKAENTSDVKNDTGSALNEHDKDNAIKPSIINELSIPVISKDDLFK